jgi:hypothetical protein
MAEWSTTCLWLLDVAGSNPTSDIIYDALGVLESDHPTDSRKYNVLYSLSEMKYLQVLAHYLESKVPCHRIAATSTSTRTRHGSRYQGQAGQGTFQ